MQRLKLTTRATFTIHYQVNLRWEPSRTSEKKDWRVCLVTTIWQELRNCDLTIKGMSLYEEYNTLVTFSGSSGEVFDVSWPCYFCLDGSYPSCHVKLEHTRHSSTKQRGLCTGANPPRRQHCWVSRTAVHHWVYLSQQITGRTLLFTIMQAWELSESSMGGDGIYHQLDMLAWCGLTWLVPFARCLIFPAISRKMNFN